MSHCSQFSFLSKIVGHHCRENWEWEHDHDTHKTEFWKILQVSWWLDIHGIVITPYTSTEDGVLHNIVYQKRDQWSHYVPKISIEDDVMHVMILRFIKLVVYVMNGMNLLMKLTVHDFDIVAVQVWWRTRLRLAQLTWSFNAWARRLHTHYIAYKSQTARRLWTWYDNELWLKIKVKDSSLGLWHWHY